MKQLGLVYLVLWLAPHQTLAQKDSVQNLQSTQWELIGQYGFIIPHAQELTVFEQERPWGLQLSWSKLLLNRQAYSNCNCYAQVGVSATHFNFGNRRELGSATGLVLFSEPYLLYKNKLKLHLRAGLGPVYLSRVFHPTENPNNTFFSARVSFLLLANLSLSYPINPHLRLVGGGYYNHISNGGWRQPNRGMNFPSLSLGLRYTPEAVRFPAWPAATDRQGSWQLYSRLFAALPKVAATETEPEVRRLQLGLAGGVQYFLGQVSSLTGGLEVIHHGNEREERQRSGASNDYHQLGVMLGHSFELGRFSFGQQLGWYAYRPYPSTKPKIYQRYELLYRLGNWQLGTGLKAHGKTAENLDLRIGYRVRW